MRYADRAFYEPRFYFADAHVFDVFSFALVRGDPATALQDPHSVVLTEAMARKYFGDADPIGKTLTLENKVDYTVTGLLADVPSQSHFVFDFLASFESLEALLGEERVRSWGWVDVHTYVLLSEAHDPALVQAKLPALMETNSDERFADRTTLVLQPITRIHLTSKLKDEISPNSDATYAYILATVALLVLLIACINFVNLTTARSADRAREVGLRKVLGAGRAQLLRQFLGESVLLVLLALGVAMGLVWLFLPLFNTLSGKTLSLTGELPTVVAGFLAILLVVGLIAGSYPALYLAAVRPVTALRGGVATGAQRARLRQALVVGQFAVTIALLIGTGVIVQQVDYLRSTTLGFSEEQVIVVPLRDAEQRRAVEVIKQEFLRHPGVRAVTASSSTPGAGNHLTLPFRQEGAAESTPLPTYLVDFDFTDTYQIRLAEGRSFQKGLASDSTEALLINEAAAAYFGSEQLIGVDLARGGEQPFTVIGVVEDFQIGSLHAPVEPLVIAPFAWYRYLSLRLSPDDIPGTLAFLEATWRDIAPERPFEYSFLDADIDRFYKADAQLGRIIGYLAMLTLFIACLGLLGLSALAVSQRTKEIGIRKVLGASAGRIVLLLLKEYLLLVAAAFVVAAPLAYIALERWLHAFAHRIEISWPIFLIAGTLVLAMAALTVSYQSTRAALADPVKSLRYE